MKLTPGQIIKKERVARGWSLRELAKRSGVSNPFLSQIENGNDFRVSKLVAISRSYGVKASYLLGEK